MRYALGAMRVAVVLVFNSAIPGPCSAEQTSLGRNLHSAFEYAKFFRDDTFTS